MVEPACPFFFKQNWSFFVLHFSRHLQVRFSILVVHFDRLPVCLSSHRVRFVGMIRGYLANKPYLFPVTASGMSWWISRNRSSAWCGRCASNRRRSGAIRRVTIVEKRDIMHELGLVTPQQQVVGVVSPNRRKFRRAGFQAF